MLLFPIISLIGFALTSAAFIDGWNRLGSGEAIERTPNTVADSLNSWGADVRDMIGDSMINTEMDQSTTNEESVETDQVCKPEDKTYET